MVIGRNGEGKSNLLEAVELLGSLRSHRCSADRDLIRRGERQSWLAADCSGGDRLELELRRQGGRQARRNGKLLERQLDLIGPLRCVGFSALDLDLVRGEPSLRRQWLDRVVLQLEPVYAELLSRYGRLLRQRSQLLRRGLGQGQIDDLLEVFDQQMALIGTRLHRRRLRALVRLEPLAAAWQERLSGGRELLQLRYQPGSLLEGEEAEAPWRDALFEQLRRQRPEELRLGQCSVGPHRDEIALELVASPPAAMAQPASSAPWCWLSSWRSWSWFDSCGVSRRCCCSTTCCRARPWSAAAVAGGRWGGPPVPGERHAPRCVQRWLARTFPGGDR